MPRFDEAAWAEIKYIVFLFIFLASYFFYKLKELTNCFSIEMTKLVKKKGKTCRMYNLATIFTLFANSTKGLGFESVRGLSLVPYPPTKIKAFIFPILWSCPPMVVLFLYIYI